MGPCNMACVGPALGPALAGCRLQHLFINIDLRSESDLNRKTDIITTAECIMYLLCFQTCGLNHTWINRLDWHHYCSKMPRVFAMLPDHRSGFQTAADAQWKVSHTLPFSKPSRAEPSRAELSWVARICCGMAKCKRGIPHPAWKMSV